MKISEFISKNELEILDELTRRGFLKGIGAASALSATGQANAGFFNSPKLFEDGVYSGTARHILGSYTKDKNGENGRMKGITITIDKNKVILEDSGEGWRNTIKNKMIFEDITKDNNQLKASTVKVKVDDVHSGYERKNVDSDELVTKNLRKQKTTTTYNLILYKDGSFRARKLTHYDQAQKGHEYHNWGYDGKVDVKGEKIK
jgi:hypothetical protein